MKDLTADILVVNVSGRPAFRCRSLLMEEIPARHLVLPPGVKIQLESVNLWVIRDGEALDMGRVEEFGGRGLNYFARGLLRACPTAPRLYRDVFGHVLAAAWFRVGDTLRVARPSECLAASLMEAARTGAIRHMCASQAA